MLVWRQLCNTEIIFNSSAATLDVGRVQRSECKDVFGPGQKRDLESRIRQVFARCMQYEQGVLF